jgi:epoxyqueuosine reductase
LSNKSHYTDQIKREALRLGFSSVGIAKSGFLEEEAPKLENYLKNGYQGKMTYLENHFDKRLDTRLLVEDSKSVISLSYNYFPEETQKEDTYKIARYAYGQDYHHIIKEKLKELLYFIETNIGQVSGRAFTDSAPVLERAWATRAGIGWQGKNTLLLQKGKGSYFILAELIIDLELKYDNAFTTDHCGTCTRCIDACPTQAILPNGIVNGSQCISYFTIELKGELPKELRGSFSNQIFGCDICQEVCPWNNFSIPHHETLFKPHPDLLNYSKQDWREITEEVFQKIFKKSAVKRTKFSGFTRNIRFLIQD